VNYRLDIPKTIKSSKNIIIKIPKNILKIILIFSFMSLFANYRLEEKKRFNFK